MPADIEPPGAGANHSPRTAGDIGGGSLRRFRVIVDYPHDRLLMVAEPDVATAPFARDRLGLSLLEDGADFVVKLVSPGSPAALAGFKADERIALIDGKPPTDWSLTRRNALTEGPVGTAVTITLEGGVDPKGGSGRLLLSLTRPASGTAPTFRPKKDHG